MPTRAQQPDLLRATEVARLLGISPATLARRVNDGGIALANPPNPNLIRNKANLFRRSEVERIQREGFRRKAS